MSIPWQRCGSLSADQIRQELAQNPISPCETSTRIVYREAAVLVPLVCQNGTLSLLFTRRTDLVNDHKGQVAFPGGSVESDDASISETALRETFEEIGIPTSKINVLGFLRPFPTITGFMIAPVIGLVPWPYDMRLSAEEVSRVFTVPLDWLADPANREERDMILMDGRNERVIFFSTYDGEKIWGVTARITLGFLKAIKLV